jgi:DNA-binding MarR family transcriptional regulator
MASPTADQNILDSFRQIVRAVRLNSLEVEQALGLSGAQVFVLKKIAAGELLSVNEIAERTVTDQSSVSVVVSKLVHKKLLLKKSDPRDKRRSLHSITPKGLKIAKSSATVMQDQILAAVGRLSDPQRELLSHLLQLVIHHAGIDLRPATMFFEEDLKKYKASSKKTKAS